MWSPKFIIPPKYVHKVPARVTWGIFPVLPGREETFADTTGRRDILVEIPPLVIVGDDEMPLLEIDVEEPMGDWNAKLLHKYVLMDSPCSEDPFADVTGHQYFLGDIAPLEIRGDVEMPVLEIDLVNLAVTKN